MNYTQTQASEYGNSAQAARPVPLLFRTSMSQSGTREPTVKIFENTLAGVPVWTRSTGGLYIATLAGAFPVDKFAGFLGCPGRVQWIDENSFSVSSINMSLSPPALGDGVLTRTSMFVFVYPP